MGEEDLDSNSPGFCAKDIVTNDYRIKKKIGWHNDREKTRLTRGYVFRGFKNRFAFITLINPWLRTQSNELGLMQIHVQGFL